MTKCLLNNLSTFTNYQVVREVKHQPILAQHLVSIPNYTSIYLDYAVLDVEITRKGYRRRRYVSVKFGMTKKQKEPLIQWEYDNRSKQPYPRIKRGREVPVKIANAGNGVRLPVDRVFLDVVCGASMATINVFNEAIDKSMGLSCKEANEGVVPDFC